MTKITIYELTWGSDRGHKGARYFRPEDQASAATRFADRVVELDRDSLVGAAWVHLKRLPDSVCPEGQTLVAWTKISDEGRGTHPGHLTVEAAGG